MSARGFLNNKDARLIQQNKATTLNPNAAEFIPSSLKSLSGNSWGKEIAPASSGKTVINRSDLNASNDSDDEAHQYWNDQLPDDITPDFNATGEKDLQMIGGLSLSGLSIHDGIEVSQFGATCADQLSGRKETLSVNDIDDIGFSEIVRFPSPSYTKDQSITPSKKLPPSSWNKHLGKISRPKGREEFHSVDLKSGYQSDDSGLSSIQLNPLDFLAAEFPGFSIDCVAEVYYKNGCDLNLTADMLNQLELQVDGGFNLNPSSKALSAPTVASSTTGLDFPALSLPNEHNDLLKYGEDLKHSFGTYQPTEIGSFPFIKHISSGTSRHALDFSAIRRFASHDSNNWKHGRNGALDMNIGSSKSSQSLPSPYSGQNKSMYTEKLEGMGNTKVTPFWPETVDVPGNMYSELREEARDFARLRTSCFEQASQAYIVGNRSLTKELSTKGQLLDSHMKASHEKARENIYGQRNQVAPEFQGYSRGQDPLINLHDLPVTEAIHVLNHELNILRRTARSAGQRLQVMIYVGTGHHINGSHFVARLPVIVHRYLHEQGLQFSEPQPGLLRVVLY